MARIIERPSLFLDMVGETLGPGDWLEITQARIDAFAEATGDDQWIHTDVARAAVEMPEGKTIAHGMLTLSLLILLQNSIYTVDNVRRAINYGANRVRNITPVQVGSRLRLVQKIEAAEAVPDNGVKVTIASVFEIEGQSKPAVAVETIGLFFE